MSIQRFDNYIGGEWVRSDAYAPNRNPSDLSDILGDYARADRVQAEQAIACAKAAFPAWSQSGVQQRFDLLDAIGAEILARKDELGHLLSREEGKTLAEGIGEVTRAGQLFKFFAGEVVRPGGELLTSTRPGLTVEITREPIGVVGLITPWNFPIAIPAWKIAPALAFGNCVVFKPAEWVPASAWALAEIIARAGVPAGVFNLVMGSGSQVGAAFVESEDVTGISFTGSEPTGRNVAATVVGRMGKVQLEMGGKNPLVVLDDADLDVAVDCAINGAFYSTGQRCTASSRLIVTAAIHDQFVSHLSERMAALKVGHALDAETQIGPVVEEQQLLIDLDYVEIAQQEGAHLAFGGGRVDRSTQGFFLSPALFTNATNAMRISREEVFGPVACVIPARDYDEALALANDTPFGLSSGIVTTSLKHATHFKRNSAAGMVMVNAPTAGVDYHVPFGGRKGSSYGPREQGRYAAEFYTSVKTAYTNAG